LVPKPTLGLRISKPLGNGGLSHKGYKMRCLHLHVFLMADYDSTLRLDIVPHGTLVGNIALFLVFSLMLVVRWQVTIVMLNAMLTIFLVMVLA